MLSLDLQPTMATLGLKLSHRSDHGRGMSDLDLGAMSLFWECLMTPGFMTDIQDYVLTPLANHQI